MTVLLVWRLPSPIPHCKKLGYVPGTLYQTLDFENFATASRSRCRQNSSSSTVNMILTDIERRAVRLRLHSFVSYLKLTKITKKKFPGPPRREGSGPPASPCHGMFSDRLRLFSTLRGHSLRLSRFLVVVDFLLSTDGVRRES